ncbi:hypothetical protein [Paenibacillus agaridevorans]|uniref:hypothetical protein n=1 Tax=Paenibacillus agaridevorans TaxID=171404 RepID=UPI001BE47AC6|nr:hypothetical protein [Paenibacillus agaridevorans]
MGTEISHYRTIVLGATFTGLGAALEDIDGTLVIERTALVGHEFINSFNPGGDWNDDTALSASGASLREELRERGILSDDGLVHLPALAPVLYNRIYESGLRVLLLTEVLLVEEKNDYVEVTIHHASGRSVVRADRLIDTRTEAVMDAAADKTARRINAMLLYVGETPLDAVVPDAFVVPDAETEIVKGKLDGELILKLTIGNEDDWVQARSKLNGVWTNRTGEWLDWRICAVATCFEVEMTVSGSSKEGRIQRLTSAAYRNPLEAYEAGIEATGRMVG